MHQVLLLSFNSHELTKNSLQKNYAKKIVLRNLLLYLIIHKKRKFARGIYDCFQTSQLEGKSRG